ncbi:MAG: Gfo/Idh/MocA family oxidoreductase [Gammaproteobacteria bacterium]|nr:Gfo/Idh/MocA family oxidoreductase [Gammaproteobacteria bacterium]
MFKPRILNFGVIGLGNISSHHIGAIQALPDCRLIAVSSRSEQKRMKAESQYGVKAFADFNEMVQLPELDVVCICTPSGQHLDACLAAAKAGKHVISEKPLEISVERAQRMIKACRDAKVKLACIFQNRYSNDYQRVCDLVKQGKLGKLILGNAYIKWYRNDAYYQATDWRGTLLGDGGAALINQSIHTIDLLLNVMGPVQSVSGKTRTLTHAIEGEDIGTAILEFKNGALGTIEGSTSIFAGFPERLEIHGDEGSAVMEAGKIVALKTRQGDAFEVKAENSNSGSSNPMAIDLELHIAQFREISGAIRNDREPEVNGEEALKALQLVRAIYESSRSGNEIVLE